MQITYTHRKRLFDKYLNVLMLKYQLFPPHMDTDWLSRLLGAGQKEWRAARQCLCRLPQALARTFSFAAFPTGKATLIRNQTHASSLPGNRRKFLH